MPELTHHDHSAHRSLWPLFALGAAGAVIAAPYVLPAIGIGTTETTTSIIEAYHPHDALGSSGLAGLIAGGLRQIPLIGESLAAGGIGTIAASSIIGLGGVLLANWMEKREAPADFPWSKVIRYGALATSMLISLPSLLTGIGVSIAFLATFVVSEAPTFNALLAGLSSTVGSASMAGMASGGGSALASMLPHLVSCGAGILPASLAYAMGMHGTQPHPHYDCRILNQPVPKTGHPCELQFQLVNEAGQALTPQELAIIHTRPIHTMIVDSSLRDYHHLHPTYDPARQCFTCSFTPASPSPYSMWNDFTVKDASAPTHLHTELCPSLGVHIPPRIQPSNHASAAGVRVDITSKPRLRADDPITLMLAIRDASGQPVADLEPIMGAYAHLVGFSADGRHLLHTHPMGAAPANATSRGTSPLQFHALPEAEGPTQFFLQIQRHGRLITVPFGQLITHDQSLALWHKQILTSAWQGNTQAYAR